MQTGLQQLQLPLLSPGLALAATTDRCSADRIKIESVVLTWMKGREVALWFHTEDFQSATDP